MKLKLRRTIKYSDSSGRAHMTVQLFLGFQYSHFCSCSPVELIRLPPTTVKIYIFCLLVFVVFFCWWASNHKSFIIIFLKCQLMIITSLFYNAHIHIHMHTHTIIYIHTKTLKVFLSVYYRCHFVISSYHKSYQQYFDILSNYKKLEIHYYKKEKK